MIKQIFTFDQWETDRGSKVLFINRPEIPMVDISVVFGAGSVYNGSKYGLSQLTNVMLKYGTTSLNADEIAHGFESVGAKLHLDSDRDIAFVRLRSLVVEKYLTKALTLLNDMLTNSHFPEDKFLYNQKLILNAIRQQQQMPEIISRNAFYASIYPNHPYGLPILGTEQSIMAFTINDLKHFYQTYYTAQNATIIIVGDLSRKKTERIANQILMGMPIGSKAPEVPFAEINNNYTQRHIPFPSSQTHIILGQVGITYHDPDYFPLIVGNNIFGGSSMTSRLFSILRGKYGLAYHISSATKFLAGRGLSFIILQTKNDTVHQAVKLTASLLSNFNKSGPTTGELLASRNKIMNGFPLQLTRNEDIHNYLLLIGYYCLPQDFLSDYCSRVEKVTRNQVKQSFSSHFSLEKMSLITVGGARL